MRVPHELATTAHTVRSVLAATPTAVTPTSATIVAAGTFLSGLAAFLSVRANRRSAAAQAAASLFEANKDLIVNYREEVNRLHAELDQQRSEYRNEIDSLRNALAGAHRRCARCEETARAQTLEADTRYRDLLLRYETVVTDFAGLRLIVQDEIAREATKDDPASPNYISPPEATP